MDLALHFHIKVFRINPRPDKLNFSFTESVLFFRRFIDKSQFCRTPPPSLRSDRICEHCLTVPEIVNLKHVQYYQRFQKNACRQNHFQVPQNHVQDQKFSIFTL